MPSTEGTVTLHKAMRDTNYAAYGTSCNSNTLNIEYDAKTTTTLYTDYSSTNTGNYYWLVIGYAQV